MARYIITGSYTSAGMRGMIAHPSDREAATRALVEASGGKMLTYLLTTGDNDFLMVTESDDSTGLIAALMVAGASGAVANLKTVQAFTSAEFVTAQKKAGALASKYAAPS
ncbi:GYD domain-containing protein [Tabrizicola sp. J26]|uniref:GYD domain-containing protein n=1 Tax=Alitabrizicola rongguiensis TaxID=2909234 RepID=UPI001F28ED4C|nr:GYD domain-containing protein [Tabrizicola rongguiensis]MCF1708498.1 GYD domain-containing protein [Tabrizicola rongguiensis]